MASQWFYQVMGERIGPVSGAELRSLAQRGTISTETPIANVSNGPWVPAGNVKGLFDVTPPPMPIVVRSDSSDVVVPVRRSRRAAGAIVVAVSVGVVLVLAIVASFRTGDRVLRTHDAVVRVRLWSDVFYLASGREEDPGKAYIEQEKLVISAHEASSRQSKVVQNACDDSIAATQALLVNTDAQSRAMVVSGLGSRLKELDEERIPLKKDATEKKAKYDQELARSLELGKQAAQLADRCHSLRCQWELYRARMPVGPVQFSYRLGNGWNDAVQGVKGDFYVPVNGKSEKLEIGTGNPNICRIEDGCLVAVDVGNTVLRVGLAERSIDIPIGVVALPIRYGDTVDEIIKTIGTPDNHKAVDKNGSEHWLYTRWPGAVLVISPEKTLYNVLTSKQSEAK